MKKIFQYTLILIIVFTISSYAQYESNDDPYHSRYAGFGFTMAETGTGLGGMMAWPIMPSTHLGVSLGVYFLRDKNEFTYYNPYYYGYPQTVNKENNVYLFDFMVSMKRRFFASDLDESFRPFLIGGVGPYYGMNFPEFDRDLQGNKTKDEYAWALGGFFGAGADIDASGTYFVSVRFQYRVIPFAEQIGQRKNHSMFEIRFEVGSRY
ncbi:hypothetical protein ACFLSX_05850 [Calditrichota bacterium]